MFGKPKIEVFVRHCYFSEVSAHKKRPKGFSRQRCHANLLATLDPKKVNVTFFLDTFHEKGDKHFVYSQDQYPVVEIQEGTETGSFLKLLEHIEKKKFSPETIIYFLEDDYLHSPEWANVLQEAFALPVDYATLYDHNDKYFLPQYGELQSKIFTTNSCHWRTTPSTTNTFAVKWKTLKEDLPVHRAFSEGRRVTADHEKFCKLKEKGSILVSSIPGYSSHMEPELLSPCGDWEEILNGGT